MLKAFAFAVPFLFLAASCTYDNGDTHNALYGNDTTNSSGLSCNVDVQSGIDTDRMIDIDAGQGAGLFIEYASGGHYHLRTACDTARSNSSCHWDVIIDPQAGSTITNATGENLSAADSLTTYPSPTDRTQLTSYHFVTETTTEIDGMTFDIDPGSAITVDAVLDDECAPQFMFWVGDGALHPGASSNPLTVTPDTP